MYLDKDGWPMWSWYDYPFHWLLGALIMLGWHIVNFGHWWVRKSAALSERFYPSATSGCSAANDDSLTTVI